MVDGGTHVSKVAMPAARLQGRRVDAADIDTQRDGWSRPLLHCLHCTTNVIPVASSIKENSRKAAFFRLYPNRPHDPGCAYDVTGRVSELIETSDGLLERRGDRYRLVLPGTLAQAKPTLPHRRTAARDEPTYTRRTSTLLNTAAKVAALVEQFRGDDPDGDLAEWFSATCGGRTIPWAAFFHTPRVAWRLAHRLQLGLVDHPVAVALRVDTSGTSRTGDSVYLDQRAPASWADTTAAHPHAHHLVVRSKTAELLAPYTEQGTWVLALGMWKRFEWAGGRRTDVCLWVDSPHQMIALTDPV